MWVCACECNAQGGHKRTLEPLELSYRWLGAATWALRTELWSQQHAF